MERKSVPSNQYPSSWAETESMPGVMAYGATREAGIANVRALALRVAANCIDHCEEVIEPFVKAHPQN